MNKFKILLFDLFFVISAIIGVGFATGREISHFFLSGKSLVLAVVVLFVVFVGLCWFFLYIKHKHNISNLTQLNKLAFGKYYQVGNIVLIIMFVVTNAAMLAGVDNLAKNYIGLNLPVISLFLNIITFFIVLGGVERIKSIANIIMPILILLMLGNAILNINCAPVLNGSMGLDIAYPIIFCCENFITLISTLIATKSKPKNLSFGTGIVLSIVVLISAVAISGVGADMPMLSISKNLGNVFFAIYFLGVIFALFTTLEITSYTCLEVLTKNKSNKYFVLMLILITSQIIAYLGFNFIVQYLYTLIGILGAIYLIVLIIKLIIADKKLK